MTAQQPAGDPKDQPARKGRIQWGPEDGVFISMLVAWACVAGTLIMLDVATTLAVIIGLGSLSLASAVTFFSYQISLLPRARR
jgi:hypothetical protein